MPLVLLSVAVSDWLPAVVSVAVKTPTPSSSVLEAGKSTPVSGSFRKITPEAGDARGIRPRAVATLELMALLTLTRDAFT